MESLHHGPAPRGANVIAFCTLETGERLAALDAAVEQLEARAAEGSVFPREALLELAAGIERLRAPLQRAVEIAARQKVARDFPQVVYFNRMNRRRERARRREAKRLGQAYEVIAKVHSSYVEAAIEGELNKLRGCPPGSQDSTMNAVAYALGCIVKGKWPGISEGAIKSRFLEACSTLRDDPNSDKGKWTNGKFEEKWRRAMEDAEPRPWKNGKDDGAAPEGKRGYATQILGEAQPLAGTIGEVYYRETRGVDPSAALGAMFFHPAVSCSGLGKGCTMPAVINVFRKEPDGKPVAIHATYLNPDGSKPEHLEVRKRTFGKTKGAAIYLTKPGRKMLTAEGTEKTLHCGSAAKLPCIAAGSSALLGGLAIPPGVEELIVCADRGGDGERNALKLAERAHAAGIKMRICFPPIEDKDWDECPAGEVLSAITEAPLWEPPKRCGGNSGGGGGNYSGGHADDEWPEPQPIEDAKLFPVPPFDAEALLPGGLRNFVTDIAYRMPCAPEYVAVAVLACAGAVIGARCAIRPKRCDDWLVVPNLWGAIVGAPSERKSPAISEGMKPLTRLIAIAAKEHETARADAKRDKEVREIERKAVKSGITAGMRKAAGNVVELAQYRDKLKKHLAAEEAAETEPALRRYKTNDSTVEKLGELLRDNPAGILIVRDELVGLIASWDRSGREGDRQFFLQAWNGTDDFDTDRIARGTILIPNLCVSLFGGMQPDKLTAYLEQASDALANDGLLQRFQLLVYPDPVPWEYRDRLPDKGARERVNDIFEKLAAFDATAWGASENPFLKFPYFYFGDAAQELYIEWVTGLHKGIEAEPNPLIAQHLGKYDKLFPALALVFHMVDRAGGGYQTEIPEICARRAAAWCDFLEAHARRCYGLLAGEGLKPAKELANRLKEPKLPKNFDPEDFTARDVYVKGWRNLTTVKDAELALDVLENRGWVSKEGVYPEGGGRPTNRYTLNPAVRKGINGQCEF